MFPTSIRPVPVVTTGSFAAKARSFSSSPVCPPQQDPRSRSRRARERISPSGPSRSRLSDTHAVSFFELSERLAVERKPESDPDATIAVRLHLDLSIAAWLHLRSEGTVIDDLIAERISVRNRFSVGNRITVVVLFLGVVSRLRLARRPRRGQPDCEPDGPARTVRDREGFPGQRRRRTEGRIHRPGVHREQRSGRTLRNDSRLVRLVRRDPAIWFGGPPWPQRDGCGQGGGRRGGARWVVGRACGGQRLRFA